MGRGANGVKSHPEWTEMKKENSFRPGSFQARFLCSFKWDSANVVAKSHLYLFRFLLSFIKIQQITFV